VIIKMVSVKIDFKKKDFVWIGLIVVLLCVGFGVAYNSGADPSVMGHSAEELEGLNVEEVIVNCPSASCSASCPAGMTILQAYTFHGFYGDMSSAIQYGGWACGSAINWMGHCIGGTSCSITTGCTSSSVYLLCAGESVGGSSEGASGINCVNVVVDKTGGGDSWMQCDCPVDYQTITGYNVAAVNSWDSHAIRDPEVGSNYYKVYTGGAAYRLTCTCCA